MTNVKVSKQFIYIWFAEFISILGTGLTEFGLNVWVYQKTGRATPLALAILCSILPVILLSPIVGYVADKFNTKWVIILSNIGALITSIVFVIFLCNNFFDFTLTCVIISLNATFNLLDSSAFQSSIIILVDKKNLKGANGMIQLSNSLNNALTPVIAGILYAFIGLPGILMIDITTYFISMLMWLFFSTIKFDKKGNDVKENQKLDGKKFFRDLNDGFRFIFERKGFTILVFIFAIINFLNNLAVVLITPLMLTIANSTKLGFVQALGGIGMMGGSFIMTFYKSKKSNISHIEMINKCIFVASICLILMGIRASFVTISLSRMMFLFCVPIANVAAGMLWQIKTPRELQGRVYAARSMIIRSFMPFAYLIVGPITDSGFKTIFSKNYKFVHQIRKLLGTNALNYRIVFILTGLFLFIIGSIFFKNKYLLETEKYPEYM